MASLVSVDEIRAAAARLAGVAVRTPLVPFPGAPPGLLVKPESLQPTGSFKLRGAYAAISALPADLRARGVVAHSSGNHAQAVAYAAALLDVPATVVVPVNAPPVTAMRSSRPSTTVPSYRARAPSAWRSRRTAQTPTWSSCRSAAVASSRGFPPPSAR